jgi:hypothetical protein
MPVVFVHGVNTRKDSRGLYDRRERRRNAFFRQISLRQITSKPERVQILNPYWGDKAAYLAWDGASLPRAGVEMFGSDQEEVTEAVLAEMAPLVAPDPSTLLLTIARESLGDAIDLLWLVTQSADQSELESLTSLARKALIYTGAYPRPPAWLWEVQNDRQFIARLQREIEAVPDKNDLQQQNNDDEYESFGVNVAWERVREGVSRVTDLAGNMGSSLVLAAARRPLHTQVSYFIGDVFVYLTTRGERQTPGDIIAPVLAALDQAERDRNVEDPNLIIIAHSMGGNIVYDILSHYRPQVECDLLVTVGSQVALFEELKVLKERNKNIPIDPTHDRISTPPSVRHWLNVYDRNDILAFAAAGVFAGVTDYEYVTGKGMLSSHSTYFDRISFHDKLGVQMKRVLL